MILTGWTRPTDQTVGMNEALNAYYVSGPALGTHRQGKDTL